MAAGSVDAVHVTICYHENFVDTVKNIEDWNRRFQRYPERLMLGRTAEDILSAKAKGKTAIFFGFQNCTPIEDDIHRIEIFHQLGVRIMQLSYNNQSLLATGCYEQDDGGITRMGRQVIQEMNRVGLLIDMSHSAERSTLEAIEHSTRPISITHANPFSWHPTLRNKSDTVLRALAESGGMLGLSLYPHHLKNGSNCLVEEFCQMVAITADNFGVDHIGIGSDLCQDQPDHVVDWMRNGRWTRDKDFGEDPSSYAGFPDDLTWFKDNRDFGSLRKGLNAVGFDAAEINQIMGGNWLEFFRQSFGPRPSS
tara:strand:- start:1413 stop:2339 length:927 start_codon:yes stop_codon:yes gene_type:complete